MTTLDFSNLSKIDFQYRPTIDLSQIPTLAHVDNLQSCPSLACCQMNYTMHGDTQCLYMHREADSIMLFDALAEVYDDAATEGYPSLRVNEPPSMYDLVSFLECDEDDHVPWSYCFYEILEDVSDDPEAMTAAIQHNVSYESDIYPDLTLFYEILAKAIIEYKCDTGSLPEAQEWTSVLVHILNELKRSN